MNTVPKADLLPCPAQLGINSSRPSFVGTTFLASLLIFAVAEHLPPSLLERPQITYLIFAVAYANDLDVPIQSSGRSAGDLDPLMGDRSKAMQQEVQTVAPAKPHDTGKPDFASLTPKIR